MCWALSFGFEMGVISIDAFQVCLKSLPNFHDENPVAFCLIFVVEIWQRFVSDVSQHAKRYSHQAFIVRKRQWGCPIFTTKIQKSFAFGALCHTSRVLYLCIRCVSTCSHHDKPKSSKVLSMLIRVAYTRKLMSLSGMDQDNYTAMIVHIIQHEYAPMAITLGTYPHYKVKSSHKKCTITHLRIGIYIHTSCKMLSH